MALAAFVVTARAQGVESPPVTSFKPDTAMPSVKVPEFVITGKARIELPKADKPTVQIDSSYFQNRELQGVDISVPVCRTLGDRSEGTGSSSSGLFIRASIGHYSTARYLVSGDAVVGGFNFNGSVAGDYTSGFIPNTLQRRLSIQGGISKELDFDGGTKSNNSMNLGYINSAYSLYGVTQPAVFQRTINDVKFGLNSDMYLNDLPLAFSLNFDRFALADIWDNTLSSLRINASTQIQFSSGWMGFNGGLFFGNHTLSASPINPILLSASPLAPPSLDRSLYDIVIGANYGNTLFMGSLSYSLGVSYLQYRDDSSSAIAKLFPDVKLSYRFNDVTSLFAGFSGSVREAGLSGILATDRYVDGLLAVINTQDNVDLTAGAHIALPNGITLTPSLNILGSRQLPVFVSDTANGSNLLYASKTSIVSFSMAAGYKQENLTAGLTLRYRKGKMDSLSSIPNLPSFDADMHAAYDIVPGLIASASILFLSSRYADLALSDRLDPVGVVNFRLSYDFDIARLPVRVFVGGDNVLNEKYFIWRGYQEFPLTLYLGVSSRIL